MVLILKEPLGPEPGQLDTQLDGKQLPSRAPYDLGMPRPWLYGSRLTDGTRNYGGAQLSGVKSAGVLAQGHCVAEDLTVCVSGADAFKFNGGPGPGSLTVRRAHTHSLGLSPNDPHADSYQGKGNMTHGLFEDVFHDIPANEGGGRHSNACFIQDSSQGANGIMVVRRNIVRGGNFSIMMGAKGSANHPGGFAFEDTAFMVEFNSPRFGLLAIDDGGTVSFDPGCAVYYHDSGGVCHFLTSDVAGFELKAWHRKTFNGLLPAGNNG